MSLSDLIIEAKEDTPSIELRSNGILNINGRSLPEDAFSFYQPVIDWMVNYSDKAAEQTSMTFNLEYFNTASAKQIYKIACILSDLSKNKKVSVRWHYDEGDKDMQASGERFSKLCGLTFELVKN